MLKDLLAFANTPRVDDAFIVIGVEEELGRVKSLVGTDDATNESNIQQKVAGKTNRTIRFSFEYVEVGAARLGVYRIPTDQARPLFPKDDQFGGKLRRNAVYVRSGSSTREMTPDEIRLADVPPPSASELAEAHPQAALTAERFLQAFEGHGIPRARIGRVLGFDGLTAAHVGTTQSTLRVLTPLVSERTCDVLGVQRDWLDGVAHAPYRSRPLHSDSIFEFIEAFWRDAPHDVELIGLRSGKKELSSDRFQTVGLLLARLRTLGANEEFRQYVPLSPCFNGWDSTKWRWRIKRVLRAADALGFMFSGYVLPGKAIEAIVEGRDFPEARFVGKGSKAWDPQGYGYLPEEGHGALESDDLRAMLDADGEPFGRLIDHLKRQASGSRAVDARV